MKTTYKILITLVVISSSADAQLVNNGANIYIQNGAYLFYSGTMDNASGTITNDGTIEVQGNFSNEGTYTSSASGDHLIMSGAVTSTLKPGGASLTNLTIDKTSGEVELGSDISVTGDLTMQSGNLELNLFNIDLGSGAGTIVDENNNSRITGINGGTVIKTATLNAPSAANPGNIGIEITSSANLGTTIIKRGHVQQTSGNGGKSIYRYFNIIPTNNSGLNATLKMYYFDGELGGVNESDLNLFRSEDNGATWTLSGEDNADQTNDWVLKNNIAQLSRWTLASKANPLPVNLIAFTATLVNNTTHLGWTTAQEISSSLFEVQRSKDGNSFESLFTVPAHGNSNSPVSYHAIDKNPLTGINYYRLKQVDIDGNYSLSPIVHVYVKEASSYQITPNPVTGIFTLHITVPVAKRLGMGLYDVSGRRLSEKEMDLSAGSNELRWNISDFANGTYFIRSEDNSMPVMKVVRQ